MAQSTGKHLINAILWVAGVMLFGIAPFLFLLFISFLSEEHIAEKEIEMLLQIRLILFVCCAIVGAVLMDFFRSGIRIKGWLPYFAIYVSPFLMLSYVFSKYLLVYVQLDDLHDFGPGILSTRLIVVFALLYSVLARTAFNRLRGGRRE